MPCHVPTCPRRVGPSGWCMTHRNRLNARLPSVVRKAATLADLIAIADHPGWRRGHQLSFGGEPGAVVWYARGPGHRMQHATAADALADIDRISGRAPAAAYMARLEAEVSALKVAASVARAERDTARAYADAIRTHRDALEERRRELAADNDALIDRIHDDRWAHAYAIARMSEMRAALDKQAAAVAGLRSELAERERDITYACEDRDEYMRERDEAVALTGRLTTLSRECAAVDQRVIDALRAELTLARRPWWRKVWAWVTGGGA